jgi:hypothetical protein
MPGRCASPAATSADVFFVISEFEVAIGVLMV